MEGNKYNRYELTFLTPGEDPRFARIRPIQLTERINGRVRAIWPTGGKLYDNQIVLISSDGKHTTILRGNCYNDLKELLGRGYLVINGNIPKRLTTK